MLRFLFLLFLIFTFISQVQADSWDDFSNIDRMWDGQKSITNKEFDQVVDALEERTQKKEEKQRKKKLKRIGGGGTSLHSELSPDSKFSEIQSIKPKDDGVLLNLPVNLNVNGKTLEKGFYKLVGEQDELGNVYICFYQSQFLKAKVEAVETQDDYGAETVDFAKILPHNESIVKVVFGSIDFNAFVYLECVE